MWICLADVRAQPAAPPLPPFRPLSRILVAQRVTTPLMVIALLEVPINVMINYTLVVRWDMQVCPCAWVFQICEVFATIQLLSRTSDTPCWQYLGAAASLSAAVALDLLLMVVYILFSGKSVDLFAWPTKRVMQVWSPASHRCWISFCHHCSTSDRLLLRGGGISQGCHILQPS